MYLLPLHDYNGQALYVNAKTIMTVSEDGGGGSIINMIGEFPIHVAEPINQILGMFATY